ncbi:MAG: peptide chain release factor N(5)-glutamine methyltransferase [Burkholderiales bacterium]|nr:peptide chain release factor N(5)-glutamine methyltransferase [Burkholderiales bacterium]
MPDSLYSNMRIADCERHSPLNKLETRILLMHVTGLNRIQLITQSDRQLSALQAQQFSALIQNRLAGEPIAYLIGEREFFGLPFYTTPAVLIPRPDTELLVELAMQFAPPDGELLDLGTGSGAIAIAVAYHRPDLQVTAVDVSDAALEVAAKNAQRNLGESKILLMQSDWYSALHGRQFHTIVSNPPYIVENDPHLQQGDLRFEPLNALTDHADGLSAYRHIVGEAHRYLVRPGWLLMEHGYDQAAAVQSLLREAKFCDVQSWRDLAGIERVSGGRLL